MSDKIPEAVPVPDKALTPCGINHLVLNVRDIEESHKFWTEILGFKQVGELKRTPDRPNPPKMRFYSGEKDGLSHHHDVALVENKDLPAPPELQACPGSASPGHAQRLRPPSVSPGSSDRCSEASVLGCPAIPLA